MAKEEKSSSKSARWYILGSIAFGSLASALFWNNTHNSKSGITDDQARNVGYDSAKAYEKSRERLLRVLNNQGTNKGLDEEDFAYINKVFTTESNECKKVLYSLGNVAKPEHQLKIVRMLGNRKISTKFREAWVNLFRQWNQQSKARDSLIPLLLVSSNPDIVNIARELQSEKK